MQKIAIIGTGISGLGAAHILQNHADVILFEKAGRLGGHARTLNIDYLGENIAVDTGFIVFNYRNYPNLIAMFKQLNVPVKKSDMSLGLSLEGGAFEWGCQGLNAVFAQRSNIVSPRFWLMIKDIMRFNKQVHQFKDSDFSLGEVLAKLKMGDDFKHRFLLPTAGAIWSSSPHQILDFPASSFIKFFDNHGLLSVNGQPQWWTVDGGSIEYVKRLQANLKADIRLNNPVHNISRTEDGVLVNGELFDQVIIAAHSDQALQMLVDASDEERGILSKMRYQSNVAYLHRDESLMPKRRASWASWNYLCGEAVDENSHMQVTYWMNRLQSIDKNKPLFVTLNPNTKPKDELIFDQTTFEHPIYDGGMIAGQKAMQSIQGKNKVWFCGAYHHNGFHEDGLRSAVEVAQMMGVSLPW
jgi:predicted NAD/FAD-binding protein